MFFLAKSICQKSSGKIREILMSSCSCFNVCMQLGKRKFFQNSFYSIFFPKKPKTEKLNRTEKSHNYKITKLQIFEIAKLQNCKIAK